MNLNKIEKKIKILLEMSDYDKVKQFTEEAYEIECPKTPQLMNYQSVEFLVKMMLSEIVELCETVTQSTSEAVEMLKSCIGTDLHESFPEMNSDKEIIAAQADALVDSYYYSLNVAAKHGIDLSKVFNEVHNANMNKKDALTGKFIRRSIDNKILKPPGWKAPDVVSVLFPEILEEY